MMQTGAWMAYLESTHFSEQLSYMTFQNWSYQLKDMDLNIILQKRKNKTERWVCCVEGTGASHWAGSVLVIGKGSGYT